MWGRGSSGLMGWPRLHSEDGRPTVEIQDGKKRDKYRYDGPRQEEQNGDSSSEGRR